MCQEKQLSNKLTAGSARAILPPQLHEPSHEPDCGRSEHAHTLHELAGGDV